MPLASLGPTPENVTPSATATAMSPPLPGPAVELAICAPPFDGQGVGCDGHRAARLGLRPGRRGGDLGLAPPAPSSSSAPGVVTLTDPPAPVPAVALTISAPEAIVICGAVTVTDPVCRSSLG